MNSADRLESERLSRASTFVKVLSARNQARTFANTLTP